ncbi:MAG: hypothetical protein KKD18_06250 [Nanoarchaeota archaeon]|nr:hypothetical protein [Nanoarchaeota archaeon]
MRAEEEISLKLDQVNRITCSDLANEDRRKTIIWTLKWVLGTKVLSDEASEDFPQILCEDYREQE